MACDPKDQRIGAYSICERTALALLAAAYRSYIQDPQAEYYHTLTMFPASLSPS